MESTVLLGYEVVRFTEVNIYMYRNTVQSYLCKATTLKRPKIGFQDQVSLNASQSIAECSNGSILQYFGPPLSCSTSIKLYCRMLQGEHSAILSTSIKLPFVIKIFVLSVFEWPFYTGFTV